MLTIGDGLVGQIPALVLSSAAGLLITRVPGEDEEELPNLIGKQMFGSPRALSFLSASLLVFAMIPGLRLPFLLLVRRRR